MKLKLRFHRLTENIKHRLLVQRELEPLAKDIPFDHAQVLLSKPSEGSDQIEASVHLEVPGPDIRVTASGYTVEAAWRKLGNLVRENWQHRLRKRKRSSPAPRPTFPRAQG
jgi:hypothetical protein